jgi:hypothetical protein
MPKPCPKDGRFEFGNTAFGEEFTWKIPSEGEKKPEQNKDVAKK